MGDPPNLSISALRALVDRTTDGLALVDPDGWRLVYANSTLAEWISKPSTNAREQSLLDWIPEAATAQIREQLILLSRGEVGEVAFTGQFAANAANQLTAEIRAQRVSAQSDSLLAVSVRPLPSAATTEIRLRQLRTDPLTGLIDRTYLMNRLAAQLRGDRSGDQCCAVLFIDVDGFKQVNDSYGHRVGDQVLREVARRLAGCVRADDQVARFGGDEFVVLLESVCGRSEIQPVVERIRAVFERPIDSPCGPVSLSVSVGVAEASPDGGTADELIDAADRAMYATKRSSTSRTGL